MKKSRIKALFHTLLGFLLIGVIGWALWVALSFSYSAFKSLNPEVAVAIIAGSTTIFAAVSALVLGRHYEAKKEREVAHREKKVILYDEFTARLFKVFHEEKNTPDQNQDLVGFLRETQRKLILWSGPKVVISFAKWHQVLTSQGDTPKAEAMMSMVDFLLALREDLGHSNKDIKRDHIVRFLLKNPGLFLEMYKNNPNVSFAEIVAVEKALKNGG